MNVSAAYGHFLDDENPAGFIGVLATKGFKGGRTGYYVTRASNIKARVQRDPPTTREGVSYHWLFQPVVLISNDGRSATGRMRLFQPRTARTVGKAGDFLAASILASTYHDRYVLEDGVWRIWELDSRYAIHQAGRLQGRHLGQVKRSGPAQSQRAPAGQRPRPRRPARHHGRGPWRKTGHGAMAEHQTDVVRLYQPGKRARPGALPTGLRALRDTARSTVRCERLSAAARCAGGEPCAIAPLALLMSRQADYRVP